MSILSHMCRTYDEWDTGLNAQAEFKSIMTDEEINKLSAADAVALIETLLRSHGCDDPPVFNDAPELAFHKLIKCLIKVLPRVS